VQQEGLQGVTVVVQGVQRSYRAKGGQTMGLGYKQTIGIDKLG